MRQGIHRHRAGYGIPRPGQGGAVSSRIATGAGAVRDRGSDAKGAGRILLEQNHVRPHQALGMQTRGTRWHRSARRYEANPPRWEYPAGGRVLKVDSRQGDAGAKKLDHQ